MEKFSGTWINVEKGSNPRADWGTEEKTDLDVAEKARWRIRREFGCWGGKGHWGELWLWGGLFYLKQGGALCTTPCLTTSSAFLLQLNPAYLTRLNLCYHLYFFSDAGAKSNCFCFIARALHCNYVCPYSKLRLLRDLSLGRVPGSRAVRNEWPWVVAV